MKIDHLERAGAISPLRRHAAAEEFFARSHKKILASRKDGGVFLFLPLPSPSRAAGIFKINFLVLHKAQERQNRAHCESSEVFSDSTRVGLPIPN